MATDLTGNATSGITHFVAIGAGQKIVTCEVDTSTYNVDVSATGALELIDVPADTFVPWVTLNVTTVEGDDVAATIGDSDADGWMTAGALNTAGGQINAGAYPTANGKVYTTADTIDITPAADLDTCIFKVSALLIDL